MNKEKVRIDGNKATTAEKIVTNLIFIAVGILLCLKISANVVSVALGVTLCLYGVINIIISASKDFTLFCMEGVLYGVIIALGIAFIVEKLLTIFVRISPYILCAVGFIFVVDAVLARFKRKAVSLFVFILELVLGVVCIALGFCLLFIEAFRVWANIIFGICLIALGMYQLIYMIVNRNRGSSLPS